MTFKRAAVITAVVGTAIAGTFAAGAAFAEPVSNSYVLVASDTLQDAGNALANGTNVTGPRVRITAGGEPIGSFDAFGSSAIQTTPGGPFFLRPNGSGAGITALRASITGAPYGPVGAQKTISGQVDIARSSSGPAANRDDANGKLAYVPFGRDALSYAYKGGSGAWANISRDQLAQLYKGEITQIGGVTVTPRLPQGSSGTRSFFLSAIGVSVAQLKPGIDAASANVPENDGSVLAAGDLIPFSVASWTAQVAGAAGTNSTAGASLGSTTADAPVTGTGASTVPNPAYYANTTFGRDTYLVVERARITPGDAKYDAGLHGLVDSSKANSLTNFTVGSSASARRVKEKFGFLAPSQTAPIYAYATL